ncbi:DKNYY domain-containing protein [Pontibacter ramchanderi]|nr:DKNYY domain-containing protein [Pontibacter ramchanderi]
MKRLKVFFFVTVVLSSTILFACSPKYKIENGQWAYITFDEAAGKRVRNISADINSFQVLKDKRYGKDRNHVFFEGRIIPKADPKSFQIIQSKGYSTYSKDKTNVFLDDAKVVFANPEKFIPFDWPYAKDDRRVFCGTIPIEIKNIEEFIVTETSGAKTSMTKSHFIKLNEKYAFLDTLDVNGVIFGEGKGETKTEKFNSYKKIE